MFPRKGGEIFTHHEKHLQKNDRRAKLLALSMIPYIFSKGSLELIPCVPPAAHTHLAARQKIGGQAAGQRIEGVFCCALRLHQMGKGGFDAILLVGLAFGRLGFAGALRSSSPIDQRSLDFFASCWCKTCLSPAKALAGCQCQLHTGAGSSRLPLQSAGLPCTEQGLQPRPASLAHGVGLGVGCSPW